MPDHQNQTASGQHTGAAPTRSRFTTAELGAALAEWGRFQGPDGGVREPGEWIEVPGELLRARVDRTDLDLLTVDAGPFVVHRTLDFTERVRAAGHVVVVQIAGHSVLHPADGRTAVHLGPGDLSYGDPSVPYRWEFAGSMTVMMLRLPTAALPLPPATLRPILGQPMSTRDGYGRLAVNFAREVLTDEEMLAGRSGAGILRDTVGHFGTLLAGRLREAELENPGDPAFQRALEYIEAHLARPLTVTRISDAAGMSPRTLQERFRTRGMSASSWVKHRRLEAARQALADPSWKDADLARIAIAHGFADHSHFTRNFRLAYGETPSAWRERSTRGLAV